MSRLAVLMVPIVCAATPLLAQNAYLDDRSGAESLVRSLYNAIDRKEYARAWDYFGEEKPARDFAAFVKGYEQTQSVAVETG